MDKAVLLFLADTLYWKEIICHEEYEAILDAKSPMDLENITHRMSNNEYSPYKKGESYLGYAKT